ncbi:MAG: cell division ATP-binding protein FtsE [Candidatus Magasanikbacteria bacterium RIFCSPLOWO2_01_FULL_43_20b]|uniref:Cell division ATP-binding protein FtsE n=1 Tax=Candidatus Magasanikbacteria bacterium RIFCSPLOWO2_12_FULL_43_12 TaxID=1798692 RepID=A0A1F6MR37_9BACT|nr:MAG: cell division ATP-binding protein FtsE [Candidatus Magasanikbacteria bacterium RIFCSPHIGHO2_02_FULL_44_13]OGH72512.1 MAG: cell division ATP-binding protein FtsE [Candidatus Magasanikbacteria bacterium RIFCSPLOWO2_02_FULL_43_22]OGH73683.1 MAG: cell division ATP-binding protein FtsE [Candidatus Magasanikbacteria bacterium RIFCSPLOWO2_01_FULL_43_20b]OGH74097.1 MAG: cell division ATP-binding protein FtsE [Candidatus Magasanikbacteria bacterium RIFCSPLOWO2_12_FULL_43_12]
MIKLANVSKHYTKDSIGLDDVSLKIEPGEFISVVGQSGTGKTTLVKLIIAEEKPTEGNIEVGGWDITKIHQRDVPFLRRQIGVIFQDFKLLPKKTVQENVAFALEVAGVPHSRIREVVPKVLDIVGLRKKVDSYPHQISGGEQQRVVIARSLVHRPKILVADEPTGNLDSINTEEIIEILKRINEFGTTILLVTHNREVVNRLRKRVVTLHNGKIIADEKEGKYRL